MIRPQKTCHPEPREPQRRRKPHAKDPCTRRHHDEPMGGDAGGRSKPARARTHEIESEGTAQESDPATAPPKPKTGSSEPPAWVNECNGDLSTVETIAHASEAQMASGCRQTNTDQDQLLIGSLLRPGPTVQHRVQCQVSGQSSRWFLCSLRRLVVRVIRARCPLRLHREETSRISWFRLPQPQR